MGLSMLRDPNNLGLKLSFYCDTLYMNNTVKQKQNELHSALQRGKKYEESKMWLNAANEYTMAAHSLHFIFRHEMNKSIKIDLKTKLETVITRAELMRKRDKEEKNRKKITVKSVPTPKPDPKPTPKPTPKPIDKPKPTPPVEIVKPKFDQNAVEKERLLKLAISAETEGNVQESSGNRSGAYNLYLNCVRFLLPAIKLEIDEEKKNILKKRTDQLLSKAESLKQPKPKPNPVVTLPDNPERMKLINEGYNFHKRGNIAFKTLKYDLAYKYLSDCILCYKKAMEIDKNPVTLKQIEKKYRAIEGFMKKNVTPKILEMENLKDLKWLKSKISAANQLSQDAALLFTNGDFEHSLGTYQQSHKFFKVSLTASQKLIGDEQKEELKSRIRNVEARMDDLKEKLGLVEKIEDIRKHEFFKPPKTNFLNFPLPTDFSVERVMKKSSPTPPSKFIEDLGVPPSPHKIEDSDDDIGDFLEPPSHIPKAPSLERKDFNFMEQIGDSDKRSKQESEEDETNMSIRNDFIFGDSPKKEIRSEEQTEGMGRTYDGDFGPSHNILLITKNEDNLSNMEKNNEL